MNVFDATHVLSCSVQLTRDYRTQRATNRIGVRFLDATSHPIRPTIWWFDADRVIYDIRQFFSEPRWNRSSDCADGELTGPGLVPCRILEGGSDDQVLTIFTQRPGSASLHWAHISTIYSMMPDYSLVLA